MQKIDNDNRATFTYRFSFPIRTAFLVVLLFLLVCSFLFPVTDQGGKTCRARTWRLVGYFLGAICLALSGIGNKYVKSL